VQYAQKLHRGEDVQDGRTEDERWSLYEHYSDSILRFWQECMTADSGARVTRNAVYEVYVQWCDYRGVDPKQPGGRNGFWPLSDTCHAVSYDREGKTLDGSRAVEHVKFDSDAMDHAPEWVQEKWEADVEEEDSVLANRLDRATPLGDLGTGYCTVEATVIGREYADKRDESGVKLTLEDGSTAIDAVAWDGKFDGVDVGDKVRMERAVLSSDNYGVPQIKLQGVTTVDVVEHGPLADVPGEDQIAADGGEDQGDDGGTDRSMDLVNDDIAGGDDRAVNIESELLDAIGEMDGDDAPDGSRVISRVAGEFGMDPEKVEHVAAKLKHRGDIYEPESGKWRCT